MKVQVEIDEKQFGVLYSQQDTATLMQALSALYTSIWTEACYDAYNDATRDFAQRLLPHIKEANRILQFKK